jgi:hypothetical protein
MTSSTTIAMATLQDPEQPLPGDGDGLLLADAPAAVIDAVVELAGPNADTPLLSVELRHLGGALARDSPDGGAQSKLDAAFAVYAAGVTPTVELGASVRAHTEALRAALAEWRADYDYYNFLESPVDADAALPRASYERLSELKAIYDPDRTMISAHPVRRAGDLSERRQMPN